MRRSDEFRQLLVSRINPPIAEPYTKPARFFEFERTLRNEAEGNVCDVQVEKNRRYVRPGKPLELSLFSERPGN
jgi:hypothetical protein